MFWLAILLLVAANVGYHVCQKTIPGVANPMLSVIITFLVAALGSAALLPFFFPAGAELSAELAKLNWASILLGLTIIAIEVGFLLLYRSGYQVSLGAVLVNSLVALALLPVGVLLFRERLLPGDIAGILLLMAGLFLIARR